MSRIIAIRSNDQLEEILKANKKVLVDFKAEWCGPCKMLQPVLEQLSDENDEAVIIQIDVDHNQDIAQKFEIMSIPTIIMFKDGKQTDKNVGFTTLPKLKEMIK